MGKAVGSLQQILNAPFSLNCVRFLILLLPFSAHKDFTDGYEGVKWAILFTTALALSSMAFFLAIKARLYAQRPLSLPVLERSTKAVFSALVICLFMGYIVHDVPLFSESFIARVAGLILTGYFAHGFYRGTLSWQKLCVPMMMAGCIFLCYTTWTASHTAHFDINTILSGAFGNINMSAFFIGVVATFSLYALTQLPKTFFYRLFILCTLWGAFTALYFSGCRSVFLGMLIALFSFVVLFKSKIFYRYIIYAVLMSVLFCSANHFYNTGSSRTVSMEMAVSQGKQHSAMHRLAMAQQTFALIKNTPLGVGPDRFEFGIVPYKNHQSNFPANDDELEKSPHNELLRWLAEEGWMTTSLLLLLVGMVVVQKRTPLLQALKTSEGKFSLSLGVLLAPEFLFQFPLQAAFPYLIVCLLVGYLLSVCFLQTNDTMSIRPSPVILGLFTMTYGTLISIFLFSKAVESKRFYSPQNLERACNLNPFNWRVCLLKGIYQFNTQKPFEAMLTFQKELEIRPTNFVAQKMMGLSLLSFGLKEKGCQYLHRYDSALNNQSQLHDYIVQTCGKLTTP